MEKFNVAVDEAIVDLVKRTYEGNTTIENKIAILINTRRQAHGNDLIQDACNEYLTLLYDEKYKNI